MPEISFVDCDFGREKPDFKLQGRKINQILRNANANSARKEDPRIKGYKFSKSGTAKAFIGSISVTFHTDKPQSTDDFLEKHLKRNPKAITSAVKKLARRLRELERIFVELQGRKKLPPVRINSLPNTILVEYIRDLIGRRSYEGKRMEVEVMTDISGGEYVPPSDADETRNIDGVYEDETYSVKPKSWLLDETGGEKKLSEQEAMRKLGVDHVVIYEKTDYDKETCLVTVSYEIYDFTQNG